MLIKNSERGKCPFKNFELCDILCVFYRKGLRVNDATDEPFPFEECAINVLADNVESIHNRAFMLQSEVGQTKNVMALKVLADLGMHNPVDVARVAIKLIKPTLESEDREKLEEKEKLLLEE